MHSNSTKVVKMDIEDLSKDTKRYIVAILKLRLRLSGIPRNSDEIECLVTDMTNRVLAYIPEGLPEQSVMGIADKNRAALMEAINELEEDVSLTPDEKIIVEDAKRQLNTSLPYHLLN